MNGAVATGKTTRTAVPMKDAIGDWPEIRLRLEQACHVLLLCEYDGSLSQANGELADPQSAAMLTRLSHEKAVTTVVFSDRFAGDLQSQLSTSVTVIAANGAEVQGPGVQQTFSTGSQSAFSDMRPGDPALELRPRSGWSTGQAVGWLMESRGLENALVICVGCGALAEEVLRSYPDAVHITTKSDCAGPAGGYWIPQTEIPQLLLALLNDVRKVRRCA